jgi:hypothetical protein
VLRPALTCRLFLGESLVGLRQICRALPHGFSVRSLTVAGPPTSLSTGDGKATRCFCMFVEVDRNGALKTGMWRVLRPAGGFLAP